MKNNVRDLRGQVNWTQANLAEKLGVSRQTVNAIETEKYDPSLPLAFKIARVPQAGGGDFQGLGKWPTFRFRGDAELGRLSLPSGKLTNLSRAGFQDLTPIIKTQHRKTCS